VDTNKPSDMPAFVTRSYLIIVVSLILAGCWGERTGLETPDTTVDEYVAEVTALPTTQITQTVSEEYLPTETPVPFSEQVEPSPTISKTPLPNYTPTPDTRQKPEQWRSWPVVPTLSPWLDEIYIQGVNAGNDPKAFSKIGDCQNIPEAFLGIYAIPGRYYFNESSEYLQETVDHFTDSFAYDNITVDGGFNFPAIFATFFDPDCKNARSRQPDPSPLPIPF